MDVLLFFGTSVVFVLLGILFSRGKGAWLIAGYNTMPAAEKAKYDETALCKAMSRLMYALAFAWLIPSVGVALKKAALIFIGTGIFLVVTLGSVIHMNTGNRFKK